MEMLKERLAAFKANTMAFFKPEGQWNRRAIFTVLLAGFIGWLFITITFGMKLKALLRKVPGVKMLFKTTRRVASRARTGARSAAKRVYRKRK